MSEPLKLPGDWLAADLSPYSREQLESRASSLVATGRQADDPELMAIRAEIKRRRQTDG